MPLVRKLMKRDSTPGGFSVVKSWMPSLTGTHPRKSRSLWMINIVVLYLPRLAASLCGGCYSYDARNQPHREPPCSRAIETELLRRIEYMLSKFHTPQCVISVLNFGVLTANQFIHVAAERR